MRLLIALICGLACLTGCAKQPEWHPFLAVQYVGNSAETTTEQSPPRPINISAHVRDQSMLTLTWDERYFYFNIAQDLTGIVPESISLNFRFETNDIFGQLHHYDLMVTPDGRCFDPDACNAGPLATPPGEAACKIATHDNKWYAKGKISLKAIRAVGGQVQLTAAIGGTQQTEKGTSAKPFESCTKGALRFDYPTRELKYDKAKLLTPQTPTTHGQ